MGGGRNNFTERNVRKLTNEPYINPVHTKQWIIPQEILILRGAPRDTPFFYAFIHKYQHFI